MFPRPWAISLLLGVMLWSFAKGAKADSIEAEIRRLYALGKRQVQQRRYPRALRTFRLALERVEQLRRRAKTAKQRARLRRRRGTFLYVLARTYHFNQEHYKALKVYNKALSLRPSPPVQRLIRKYIRSVTPYAYVALSITSEPSGARVEIKDVDGRRYSAHTPLYRKVPHGPLQLKLTSPQHTSIATILRPQRGVTSISQSYRLQALRRTLPRRPPTPRPKPSTARRGVAWTFLVVGIAAGVGSAALLAISQAEIAQFDLKVGKPQYSNREIHDHRLNAQHLQIGMLVSLGVSVVSLAVMIGLFATEPPSQSGPARGDSTRSRTP